ncbi:MAG: DUF438 domain-containing protein [Firmicutes bacterium]|nr:DUF438 domain-containing protein [Bacillota bacterium]
MSEYLGSREAKQEMLKNIIKDLHQGKDFNEVKAEFQKLIRDVDATEIANMDRPSFGRTSTRRRSPSFVTSSSGLPGCSGTK